MKKILIIGAGGFVGSYLTKILSSNHYVIPLHKGVINLLDNNSVATFLEANEFDYIINCLTYGGKENLHNKNAEDVGKNISMFYNFFSNRHLFKTYINIGSGIERYNIENSYSFSKRIISNIGLTDFNFVTLNLYGCFGSHEPDIRLLKRYNNSIGKFELENDRLFDYISIQDFSKIVECVINFPNIIFDSGHSIDCVYQHKLKLSEFLDLYCDINNLKKRFEIKSISENKYVGSYKALEYIQNTYNLRLYGLAHGLKVYND